MTKALAPLVILILLLSTVGAAAQDGGAETLKPQIPASAQPAADGDAKDAKQGAEEAKTLELPGLTRLSKDHGLWIDLKRKWVVIDARVTLTRGVLEMFACPRSTKEHESVVAIDCPARFAHTALLAVGAEPGTPVQFDPKYVPASGPVVDVYIIWVDKDGKKQSARAQEWIRNTRTKKQLKHPFIFAGSDFWEETVEGKPFRHYQGDAGDFICVSNFPSATLDLPIQSSKENSNLLYEAYTGRIPPRGTRVRLVLVPRPAK